MGVCLEKEKCVWVIVEDNTNTVNLGANDVDKITFNIYACMTQQDKDILGNPSDI